MNRNHDSPATTFAIHLKAKEFMPAASSPAPDHVHADIGIVCALPIEMGAFLERCEKVKKYSGGEFVFRGGFYDGIRVAVVEAGMGFAQARRAGRLRLAPGSQVTLRNDCESASNREGF